MTMGKWFGKQTAGLLGGILAGAVVWLLPLAGLANDGKKCLALSIVAVIWWATGAMHPGFSSMALLLGYVLLLDPALAPASLIFGLWTSPTIYLVVGGFLIAEAVKQSGLGERLALLFIRRFVNSYTSIIVSCYVLGFLLSFMIPHPWPRSFLLISIMAHVINAAGLDKKFAANIGLAVFAGSIPTAMILLTGDSTLNPAIAGFAATEVSWIQWLVYMGLPGVSMAVLTCIAQLKLFKRPQDFSLNKAKIENMLAKLGTISRGEKKLVAVLIVTIALWATDSMHGISSGWIALLAVIALSSPFVRALDGKSWSQVNLGTLFFLCAALSIGTVGKATGMNEWVVSRMLPASAPSNVIQFALMVALICMALHMVLGSTLAVMSICAPAMIAFGVQAGFSPLVPALLAYTAVAGHWLLPFHHMNLLVGVGDSGGGYNSGEVFKLGVVQTVIVLAVVMLEIAWWALIGIV